MEFRKTYLEVRIDVIRDDDGEFRATLDDNYVEYGQGDTPQEAVEHLMQLHDDAVWWPPDATGARTDEQA